jgi:hypothetical protein
MREPLTGTLAIRLDASRRAALTVKRSGFLPRRARSSTALRGYRQKMRTDATASYGRHGNTLSPHEHGPEGRTGYAGWGQYENGHLEVYHGRGVTLDTLDHMEAVTACLRSASVLAVTMYRPRGQNIAYCDTCEHNDRQRGDTMSLFRWLKSGRACLLIRTDVLFYVSLVTFHGVSFLPICVHPPTQAGAEPMLLGYVWQTDGRAREIVIKYSSIDSPAWRPVGLLDVVVCGIREGQVCASAERVSECASAHVVGERGSEVSTPPTCHLELCSRAAGLVLPTTRCPPVRGDSPALDRAR